MELWIRSQDKETLIKTENVSIDSENYIIGNLISDDNKSVCDYWRLGHYETKERALEVLDEIQKRIIGKQGMITSVKRMKIEFVPFLNQVVIYEMPKE